MDYYQQLREMNGSFWGNGEGDPAARGAAEVDVVEVEGLALEEGQRAAVAIGAEDYLHPCWEVEVVAQE